MSTYIAHRAISLPKCTYTVRSLATLPSPTEFGSSSSSSVLLTPQTKRLRYRRLHPTKDVDQILRIHDDGETHRLARAGVKSGTSGMAHGPLSGSRATAMTREEAEKLAAHWSQRGVFSVMLELCEQATDRPTVVGMMAITTQAPQARFGLALARPHQGQGFGSEGLGWLVNRGFEQWGLKVVQGHTLVENTLARSCFKRLGFEEEAEEDGLVHLAMDKFSWAGHLRYKYADL